MLLEVYSNDAWSKMMTTEWFTHFKYGRTLTDDCEQSDRPSKSRSEPLIAQVKNIICGNHQLTARKVAKKAGVSIGSCHRVLMEDLGMHLASAKIVSRLLTDDQKLQHFPSVKISPQRANDKNLLKNVSFFFIWFVRLLALWPLLAYCPSLR
jgi:hypothetical protein